MGELGGPRDVRPLGTIYPTSYGRLLPTRAAVVKAAATRHDLQPELIAAFLLAKQRDQSQYEDAKDIVGATSPVKQNTSIELGQVVISTRSGTIYSKTCLLPTFDDH